MTTDAIYNGFALDGETALALLQWSQELGADEPILDMPLNRYEEPEVAPWATQKPAPARPKPKPEPEVKGPDYIAEARQIATEARDLDDLARRLAGFDGIECKKGARNFVFCDGHPGARVMILGEAPGADEDAAGRPFVGRAGQLLDAMFAAIGLSRQEKGPLGLYITNVLNWRPEGNRDPRPEEIAMMRPIVERHIALADPDILILMGNAALDTATGKRGILRARGHWITAFDRPTLPMTHPAYLLRNPIAKREAWADLLEIQARLDTIPPR